jgi:hypothetical protein
MHWYKYNEDGTIESRYDADLREARKQKLFISITTVDKEIRANWAIGDYLQRQTVKACLDNPSWANEDQNDYLTRIRIEAGKHSKNAASKGDEIHKVFEDYPQMPLNQDYLPYYDLASKYYDTHIISTRHREIMLAHPRIGIAGRMDFIGEHKKYGPVIIDWKTQEFKHKDKSKTGPRKAGFWESWPRQLAAGRYMYWLKTGEWRKCVSVAIDSKEAGMYEEYLWTDEEIDKAYQEFLCHAWLYFTSKNYWPCGKWELEFEF